MNVHCRAAGWFPDVEVSERLSEAGFPGDTVAEDKASVSVCAKHSADDRHPRITAIVVLNDICVIRSNKSLETFDGNSE